MSVPCQVSDPGSPRAGTRPEAPHFLARRLIERGQEAADALVAARRARDHEIADDERRGRRAVVLRQSAISVSQSSVPREPVRRQEMRVIGHHEHAIAGDGNAAVDAAGGVAGEAFRARPLEVPDLAARCRHRARSIRWRT